MNLEMLRKIDRQFVGDIDVAKKKISLIQTGKMTPCNDALENAYDERDRAVNAHLAWINRSFPKN